MPVGQSPAHLESRIKKVRLLKQEPGGEILAHGGTQFARSLIRLDR